MRDPISIFDDEVRYQHNSYNTNDEMFGKDRLKNILDENVTSPLSELKSKVLDALHQHTKKGLTHDDVTLIALEIC